MMKRYIIDYLDRDASKLSYLIEISKSGKRDGITITFLPDETKFWQCKYKNNLLNGIEKSWWKTSKNYAFINCKRGEGNEQGIRIHFG